MGDGLIRLGEQHLVDRAIAMWKHAAEVDDPVTWLVTADACEEGGFAGSAASARDHSARAVSRLAGKGGTDGNRS